jgi:hypothetical protein
MGKGLWRVFKKLWHGSPIDRALVLILFCLPFAFWYRQGALRELGPMAGTISIISGLTIRILTATLLGEGAVALFTRGLDDTKRPPQNSHETTPEDTSEKSNCSDAS